jgi:hypothetical protein
MKEFRNEGRLTLDNCALVNKEIQNIGVNNYNLYNSYFTKDCGCDIFTNYLFDNNLVIKDGYGFASGCSIDKDTELRLGQKITHDKERQNLCARSFQGVPNLNKGGIIPNIDSRLKNADDTSDIRSCDKITEKDFNRYQPLVGCLASEIQNPKHIVEPWVRGGNATRWDTKINHYLNTCTVRK